MFWIPIFVILLMIYFCKALTDGFHTYHFKRDYQRSVDKRQELERLVKDIELEYTISKQLRHNYSEWTRLVQEFMGGDKKWGDYADFRNGFLKALTVAMLKHNKLPSELVFPTGFHLWCSETSPSAMDGNGFSPREAREMDEEFLLRVEQELRTRHIDAVVICQASDGLTSGPWMPLKTFIDQNGKGATNCGTSFQFTHI